MVAVVAGALISAAFGDEHGSSPTVAIEGGAKATATPAATATVDAVAEATATPPASTVGSVRGFAFPVEGGCLPQNDDLMPGAPRPYRKGVHEGVDFYDSDNCTPIGLGTDVLAAKAGIVIRADWEYEGLTKKTLAELMDRVKQGGGQDSDVEDTFRGRQVWVDCGGGIVTRYVHLSGIAEGLAVGDEVAEGQLIAYAGDTGTPESVTKPGTEMHLHFEIRVGDHYLGQGDTPEQTRLLYQRAFGVTP